MIMRILGEGQYEIADAHLDKLNEFDAVLQSAAASGDEQTFAAGLRALLDAVRALGAPLPPETLAPSDLILPGEDTSLHEVQALLAGEGLIPG
ncbi:PspA-associated protein PspAA [Streptomyces sp. NBC_00024]|uniref:PspA-associated protein PspAA n=1 Tax=Streptomyces sp. NBC_00024 TaxID=2903612 RepID=UPI00324890A2